MRAKKIIDCFFYVKYQEQNNFYLMFYFNNILMENIYMNINNTLI